MATTGAAAWEKHFKGKGDIETTLKVQSSVFDEKSGATKILDLPANYDIIYLKTSKYESKALISFVSGKQKLKGRVKFDDIAKPGIKSSSATAKFKPSDIKPSIVNTWLTSEQIANNVITYVKKFGLTKDVTNSIIDLVTKTESSTSYSIPFDSSKKDLVPSEFFEVLTALKLSVLLKNNDQKIRKILGVPKAMNLSRSKIKIYIPQQANFPLIDYYISVTASDSKSEDTALKISVKSKVKSAKANTIKFRDIFDNVKEVNSWYNSLNSDLKNKQKGPKNVAESAMTVYNNYTGKSLFGVPIKAVDSLIKNDKVVIKNITSSLFGSKFNFGVLEKLVSKVSSSLASISSNTALNTLIDSKFSSDIDSLILDNMESKGAKAVTSNVVALAYLCEKILVAASKENSYASHNYYQMFFDKVLVQKEIAYAVSSMRGNTLNYDFYSLVNFAQEYASWLSLRSKNQPTALSDVIGIDV